MGSIPPVSKGSEMTSRGFNSTPRVSICIPAYEQPDYLKVTLDSIIMQDFDDYEIVITDDSTPNGYF
jgi:cellulose synthase/poly-beta-1,6-N-acetylglucosamine synthase-like glycosyltransferase